MLGGNTPFTKGTEAWGLQGFIRIQDSPGDWVFFFNLGEEVGHHEFDQKLTDDSVLTWQSQLNRGFLDGRVS